MADVARLAGVSTQTVSRYFTGVGYVRAETRSRITTAIDELGYVPNQSARNLRSQRTNTVGVLAMGALNYGSAGVLTGLGQAAREADVTLMIAELDLDFDAQGWEGEAKRALSHFLAVPVDGVVVSTPIPGIQSLLAGWDETTPIITVAELPYSPAGSASTHSYSAGLDATRYLASLGHRRIIHIAGPATRNEANERERGYRDAITEAGLEPLVVPGATDWSSASGYRAGGLVDPDAFTAVFAANDEIALGFMSAMEQRGHRAPSDFAIVGVDDMPTAAYFSPPLTSMRIDFRAVGDATFRMLHHQIRTGERAEHLVIEPELVIRESTAPPAI
ncbi:LacI family DNA-binding transcriptional regulator [Microbacterium cremeum]|uniref:LacI family DNA-binding transcriptional regulator n=1 Tax=Microbacterium cremeum TaxID=2782169 RepID=UPI001887BD23|nr:LacI family DNA-binding transcriptional regulator [Microbacterium cremeum]